MHKQRKRRQAFENIINDEMMALSPSDIKYIRDSFSQMRSKGDLLNLLNFTKRIIYGEKSLMFQLKHLNYHSNPKANKKRYKQFSIEKRNGDERIIFAPTKGLKAIQTCLNLVLQTIYDPNSAATGFVPGRSILNNASIHAGSLYVYNIDLKDFFHSVDQARIWKCFQLRPFNLVDEQTANLHLGGGLQPGSGTFVTEKEKIHFSIKKDGILTISRREKGNFQVTDDPLRFAPKEPLAMPGKLKIQSALSEFSTSSRLELAGILASLCCTQIEVDRKTEQGGWEKQRRNVLPQGAPTSPIITNIICNRLDLRLSGVAKRFGLRYSRYADDITFSSSHYVYSADGEFLAELNRIIQDQNFEVKESKTRLQKEGYRQEVTGLVVNRNPNVRSRYVKQLRMWLYYWETYGYDRASNFFYASYQADKGQVERGVPGMVDVIGGKLDFLKMVKGQGDGTYLKLRTRFERLQNPEGQISSTFDSGEASGMVPLTSKFEEGSSQVEKKHNPRDVADFMSLFNQREGLKYLTHDFDEQDGFDIESFLLSAKDVFKQKTRWPLSIPPDLWSIVDAFAFDSTPKWGEYGEITEGFSSKEWRDWSISNRLHPIRNQSFKQVIDKFRDLTRIQAPRLEIIMEDLLSKAFGNSLSEYDVQLTNLDRADFYTNISSFKRATFSILQEMKKFYQHKQISIRYDRSTEGEYFVRKLIMMQHNSFPAKELELLVKEWSEDKGAMGGIRRNFMGYCNWSVETKVDGLPVRINILRDNTTRPVEQINNEEVQGFAHIMTFYYK